MLRDVLVRGTNRDTTLPPATLELPDSIERVSKRVQVVVERLAKGVRPR